MKTMTSYTRNDLGPGIQDGVTLHNLARGWLKQGNPVVALELLRHALASTEAERDRDLRARIHKETGRALMMQSDWERADFHYVEAQRAFASQDQHQGAAECARNRANMYFQNGRYADAQDLCEQALEWASAANDYQLRATILNTQAAIAATTGELEEAVRIFKLCLSDFQSAGNTIRQGYVLLNIGLTQTDLGQFGDAVESLNRSLAIALDEKDLQLVEICYQNIAKCYLAQKEYFLAGSVTETARKILPGLNSKALEAELNLLDAKIARLTGDLDRAKRLLDRTHAICIEYKLRALTADVLFEQGHTAKDAGKTEPAVSKFNAAANAYRHIGADKGLKEAISAVQQLRGGHHA